jgi:hypothetical protein
MSAGESGLRPAHQYFSAGYGEARSRLRSEARRAGASLHALPLAAAGPAQEELTIDIAWLGERDAARVLLHTSGIHGVEAFAGSAIQLALLDTPLDLPPGTALVLAHVLNPFGMAWLRRANENNVDLNRNFLGEGEAYAGAPPLYAALDAMLNPRSPPRRDGFAGRAILAILRHGYPAVKQAVAQGQYDYPQGLFYGGARLEEGPRRYMAWLHEHLRAARTVLAVDVHTGLGRRGEDALLAEPGYQAPPALAAQLGGTLLDAAADDGRSYVVRGGLGPGVARALPHARLHALVQEFGTDPVLKVIGALRQENRWHFHGGGTLDHPAKRALLDALRPDDARWREAVVARGVAVARGGLAWLTQENLKK